MTLPELVKTRLLGALGQKLLSVNILVHVFSEKKDTSPQQIGLFFDGCAPIRMYGGNNGASLCVSLGDVVGVDLGEYGKQIVFCASSEPCFSSVVGRRLVSVSTIHSSVENELIGLFFLFDDEACLSILNLGDEIFVYGKIPEEIIAGEGLSLILL